LDWGEYRDSKMQEPGQADTRSHRVFWLSSSTSTFGGGGGISRGTASGQALSVSSTDGGCQSCKNFVLAQYRRYPQAESVHCFAWSFSVVGFFCPNHFLLSASFSHKCLFQVG